MLYSQAVCLGMHDPTAKLLEQLLDGHMLSLSSLYFRLAQPRPLWDHNSGGSTMCMPNL